MDIAYISARYSAIMAIKSPAIVNQRLGGPPDGIAERQNTDSSTNNIRSGGFLILSTL